MQPRLIITRANGKCVIDTNAEEDKAILITVVPALPHDAFCTIGALNEALERYLKDECKEQSAPKEQCVAGTGGYLDKEAVLKALHKVDYDETCTESRDDLIGRLLQGEFDVPEMCCHRQNERDRLLKAVAEKDAEIARLKIQIEQYKKDISWLENARRNDSNAIQKLADDNYMRDHPREENVMLLMLKSTVSQLRDRIAQQDQELKDLGEALRYKCQMREAAEQKEPERYVDEESETPCPQKGIDLVMKSHERAANDLGKALQEAKPKILHEYTALGDSDILIDKDWLFKIRKGETVQIVQKEPQKDEPELVICPNHLKGCLFPYLACIHRSPHKKTMTCEDGACPKCISVKKEPTVPQEQQSEVGTDFESCSLPRMTKDIGDLTLRMDNLENMERLDRKRIENLEQKRLMDDSRGNTFEGQIDRLEDALKSLKEEVAAIKNPSPRTGPMTTSGPMIRYEITEDKK